ncbi:hypothetical protein [Mesobacillus selenatarsenatis]|uniref:Uncharacterized protein n=1 Tax=Mesobacillus selenatarsenatis TaxID=388741 RepID=A0A846TF08_9BACI|nr:hypothetical protein [Mesobacillus selenatarsenatis]NKE03922.1 hypothetical protein [Mesobacillus selenatarsenatis]
MKRMIALSCLLLLCVYLVYNTPQISKKNTEVETVETGVTNDLEPNEEILDAILPEFEYVHEKDKDKEVDGYIVETYREYEVHRDQNGNIIKQMPTSNYEYVRYKNY